jgi:hypothetical protein
MKLFKSPIKNKIYFGFRLVRPVFDPVKFVRGLYGYTWFIRDAIKFKNMGGKNVFTSNLYPILNEKTFLTTFDAHYFYQQLWVFEEVLKNKPKKHVDIGSTYQMSGYISKIVPTLFIDIRPIQANLPNLTAGYGDLLNLDIADNSVNSLSCLHVIEHVGLGRYGDKVDPKGFEKSCKTLSRILAPGGNLYLSTPFGRDRVCFNAHRVSSSNTILKCFKDLKLVKFNVVNDEGTFLQDADPKDYNNSDYACGMFQFTKNTG